MLKNLKLESPKYRDIVSRLKVLWYGENSPIATNDTEEGRQQNRRVEMEILE